MFAESFVAIRSLHLHLVQQVIVVDPIERISMAYSWQLNSSLRYSKSVKITYRKWCNPPPPNRQAYESLAIYWKWREMTQRGGGGSRIVKIVSRCIKRPVGIPLFVTRRLVRINTFLYSFYLAVIVSIVDDLLGPCLQSKKPSIGSVKANTFPILFLKISELCSVEDPLVSGWSFEDCLSTVL